MDELYLENNRLRWKLEKLEKEVNTLKQLAPSSPTRTRKPQSFWDDIITKLKNDTEAIKSMINNETITVDDYDVDDQNLLHFAATYGNWEIVQLCINLGADIYRKDKYKYTPLMLARRAANPHIEQLLLLSEMKANIGDKIENISTSINKQKGIIESILDVIDDEYKNDETRQFVKETFTVIMIKVIEKRLIFSDDLLCLCWRLAADDKENSNDALKSDLWATIQRVCEEIIGSSNKRDWFWLKNCMLTSNIWFTKNKKEEKRGQNEQYLFYELLKLVGKQEKALSKELGNDLKAESETDKASWSKLINLDIEDEKLTKLTSHPDDTTFDNKSDETKDDVKSNDNVEQFWQSFLDKKREKKSERKSKRKSKRPVPRQDNIPNGLTATYNQQHLHRTATTTSFDGAAFYDYNQYLSQLALIAQSVNDEFHKSIQEIFNIDKQTKIGRIKRNQQQEQKSDDDNNNNNIVIQYTRGPIKILERAQDKVQNEYFDQRYPTSANVLDFNRCSFTFKNVPDLLQSVDLFINKIRAYQSGNIIGIARMKNGFRRYVDEYAINGPQYADIKMNVVIRGNQHNIIGEVQFLLERMLNFKKRAHNLYGITRNEEFYRLSISKLLPTLTDSQQQLKVSASMGDNKGILEILLYNNQKIEDIINQDIVRAVCESGNDKAFSLFSNQENILEWLFTECSVRRLTLTPIEWCIRKGHQSLLGDIFNIKAVREVYKNSERFRYRAVYTAFSWCGNSTAIDVLFEELNLNRKQLRRLIDYEYPEKKAQFSKKRMVARAIWENSLEIVQRMAGILEKHQFIYHVLKSDYAKNMNALEYAIEGNKTDVMEYLFSFQQLQGQCDEFLQWRLCYWAVRRCAGNDIWSLYMDKLGITKEVIIKLISSRYTKPYNSAQDAYGARGAGAVKYCDKASMAECISFGKKRMYGLQTLLDIIGERGFMEGLFLSDAINENGLEKAMSRNRFDVVKLSLSLECVRNRILNDKEVLWRVIYWMQKSERPVRDYIVAKLKIDEKLLNQVISYKVPEPKDKTKFIEKRVSDYWNKNLRPDIIEWLLDCWIE